MGQDLKLQSNRIVISYFTHIYAFQSLSISSFPPVLPLFGPCFPNICCSVLRLGTWVRFDMCWYLCFYDKTLDRKWFSHIYAFLYFTHNYAFQSLSMSTCPSLMWPLLSQYLLFSSLSWCTLVRFDMCWTFVTTTDVLCKTLDSSKMLPVKLQLNC